MSSINTRSTAYFLGMALFILFFIAIVAVMPILTIASLNTLFGLGIPYTVWTYLASFWITGLVGSGPISREQS